MACRSKSKDPEWPGAFSNIHFLLMNRLPYPGLSGVEISADGVRHRHGLRATADEAVANSNRKIVGIDLGCATTTALTPISASIESSNGAPVMVMPVQGALRHLLGRCMRPSKDSLPSLHFGYGYAGPHAAPRAGTAERDFGSTADTTMHGTRDGRRGTSSLIQPITGGYVSSAAGSPKWSLRFNLTSSLLLRLAAVPGKKRFVVHIPANEKSESELIAGCMDESGVRAIHVSRARCWFGYTADDLPVVPFRASSEYQAAPGGTDPASDTAAAGSFDALIDLLLALAGDEVAADKSDAAKKGPAPKSGAAARPRGRSAGQRPTTVHDGIMGRAREALRSPERAAR
jgi:hypothetical protein